MKSNANNAMIGKISIIAYISVTNVIVPKAIQ